MSYKGIAKGKIIDGQPVSISVEPFVERVHPGSPVAVRQVMHEPPHLRWEDVDELERAIEEGKLPVHQQSVFDEAI
jgi:hypothetical protein